jgi:hypothetical protein
MHDLSEKDYKHFTPVERINLTIAALARGDIKEADRCWDTCPRHEYKAFDFDFTIRMHAVLMLRMEFRENCFYHYNKIKVIEIRTLHLECCIDDENFEDRMNILVEVRTTHVARLKAVYCALRQFCSDVGLCVDTFLQNCHIEEQCSDIDSYLTGDTNADAGFMEHYKQTFSMYWQGLR